MLVIDTVWMLLCGAMVIFMQAGFAMLETGFTREKNTGNIIMKNLMDICIGAPLFILFGFGIMYGKGNLFIGELDLMLKDDYSMILPKGVPLFAFVFFQLAFCATAATIVSGAMAERTKFSAYCMYSAIISALVFPVIGHWVWGNGWLGQMGFHDFAGGALVHTVGGTSAFVGAALLGARIGKYTKDKKAKAIPGHNITLGALGVFILWFGWYGFNGGSILSLEENRMILLGKIFLNTTLSATLSAVFAMITSAIKYKKADISMSINGLLAGLVVITAGCDTMNPLGAAITGITAGVVLVNSIDFIDKKCHVDDPVGAISVHGVCGMLGVIMTGLLSKEDGLFFTGKTAFFGVQFIGVLAIITVTACVMFVVFKLIDITAGLRVDAAVETQGLDIHEHGLKKTYNYNNSMIHDYLMEEEYKKIEDIEIGESEDNTPGIYKVELIMKQDKFELFKEAMRKIGVTGMTVTNVYGCGIQHGMSEYYRGVPLDVQLLSKVKVEIVVAKVPVSQVIDVARKVLYTGHIGDGKIFVYDIREVVKVRTGARGYDAMQGLQD